MTLVAFVVNTIKSRKNENKIMELSVKSTKNRLVRSNYTK